MIDHEHIEKLAATLAERLTREDLYALRTALLEIIHKLEAKRGRQLPPYSVRVPRMQQVVTPVPAAEIVAMSVRGD